MNKKLNNDIFNKFPQLESERLIFREFQFSDANELFLLRSNDQVMRYMDTAKHQTTQESENLIFHINECFKLKTGINWATIEKSNNNFIGYFGFWRIIKDHCRAEIGFALKPECWNKGFMTESLNTLIKFGFKNLKLHSIEANVNPQNESSKHVLENAGFMKEAYFRENYLYNGRFIDSVIYGLLEPNK